MTQTYVHKSKRGFFGWLFLLVFLGWNALMAMWLLAVGDSTSDVIATSQSDAERAGAAIGTGIGVMMILFVWCVGAVITGLLALLTRGSTTVVTQQIEPGRPIELGRPKWVDDPMKAVAYAFLAILAFVIIVGKMGPPA